MPNVNLSKKGLFEPLDNTRCRHDVSEMTWGEKSNPTASLHVVLTKDREQLLWREGNLGYHSPSFCSISWTVQVLLLQAVKSTVNLGYTIDILDCWFTTKPLKHNSLDNMVKKMWTDSNVTGLQNQPLFENYYSNLSLSCRCRWAADNGAHWSPHLDGVRSYNEPVIINKRLYPTPSILL